VNLERIKWRRRQKRWKVGIDDDDDEYGMNCGGKAFRLALLHTISRLAAEAWT
jgi:hypothetical protein